MEFMGFEGAVKWHRRINAQKECILCKFDYSQNSILKTRGMTFEERNPPHIAKFLIMTNIAFIVCSVGDLSADPSFQSRKF